MINALAAVINHLAVDPAIVALVGSRIGTKHKFGIEGSSAWPKPSKALTLAPSGGTPDLDVEWQRQRIEARCYGERAREAGRVYDTLIAVTRDFERTVVTTADGDALIYFLVLDSGPDGVFDAELELDYVQVFLRTAVAEVPVP